MQDVLPSASPRNTCGSFANRYGNDLFLPLDPVIDRGTAIRAEVEDEPVARVADTDVLRRTTIYRATFSGEPRLGAEDASRAALARKAVANGHANRVHGRFGDQLATATRCFSDAHGVSHDPARQAENSHGKAAPRPRRERWMGAPAGGCGRPGDGRGWVESGGPNRHRKATGPRRNRPT